jgi:hypothetical protein
MENVQTGRSCPPVFLATMLLLALPAYSQTPSLNDAGQQKPTGLSDPDPKPEGEPSRELDRAAATETEETVESVNPQAAELQVESNPVELSTASMNLDSLKSSLRKSKAIGLFTKLELKNQVNELVQDFDNYHNTNNKLSIDQLKDRFGLLLMKVLVLLQDDDPPLHNDIVNARAPLWETLADPVRFAALNGNTI